MSLFEAATNPPTHPKYHPNRFEFWLLHFENHDSESAPYLRKPQRIFQLKVVYGSAWEVTGGDIQLSIEKSSGVYEGMVMIRYRDSQNVEAKIQNDLDDI